LPYPLPPIGTNFVDYIEHWQDQAEKRGIDSNLRMKRVVPEMLNPYAVGHFINHPPPDVAANVMTVDFDLPYTFFPSYMARYLPIINCREPALKRKQKTSTRSHETLRAVAIVS